jgi:hypothetical protein
MSNSLVARSTIPESMQISDCVVEGIAGAESPVAQFESALGALVKTASTMNTLPDPSVIGEMMIVAAVASVESYFRGAFAALADVCPVTAQNIGDDQISFGAVRSYPSGLVALATLERVLFSSSGVIAAQLKRFTKFDVKKHAELRDAIVAFESACVCRHSVAHWRGYLDSRTMTVLGLNERSVKRFQLNASFALVQRVFAACDHVVHVANQVLFDLTLRKWQEDGIIQLQTPHDKDDERMCTALVAAFASDSRGKSLSGPDLLQSIHDKLAEDLAAESLDAAAKIADREAAANARASASRSRRRERGTPRLTSSVPFRR